MHAESLQRAVIWTLSCALLAACYPRTRIVYCPADGPLNRPVAVTVLPATYHGLIINTPPGFMQLSKPISGTNTTEALWLAERDAEFRAGWEDEKWAWRRALAHTVHRRSRGREVRVARSASDGLVVQANVHHIYLGNRGMATVTFARAGTPHIPLYTIEVLSRVPGQSAGSRSFAPNATYGLAGMHEGFGQAIAGFMNERLRAGIE